MCKALTGTIVVISNVLLLPIAIVFIVIGAIVKWNPQFLIDRIRDGLAQSSKPEELDAWSKFIEGILKPLTTLGFAVFLLGLILFCVTTCGILGVCCRNKLLLGIYAAVLLIIFLSLLSLTILVAVEFDWLKNQMQDILKQFIVNNYKVSGTPDTNTIIIHQLQSGNRCCGSKNYQDYNELLSNSEPKIPVSCCKKGLESECLKQPTPENSYMNNGCSELMWSHIEGVCTYVLGALIGVTIITLIYFILSAYLLWRFKKKPVQRA
ncbi:hypothetical protein EG68_07119 [Paragonimus skrjabini miyazakii]|uniref:Tetraspanin n=1 Tax=Paragonimus skrjabini miyazakii TaxID=59628 RepID=A0A8S9YT37_9TREM|nr:hypothetical protein EG68_07119 [Paragonimus skrjabini miyazakii]